MECVIDTNVLIDYVLLDTELNAASAKVLEKVDGGLLPTVVIEEFAQVLERLKFGKKMIDNEIRELLDSYDVVSVDKNSLLEAQKIIMSESSTQFKRFNDKIILAIAKSRNLPLLTFDKELIRECKAHGIKLAQE